MPEESLEPFSQLNPAERREWQLRIEEANRYNILCHCRSCDREWVASSYVACSCGSSEVEHIACWQFPDD
jgi:hypothetical protein